MPKLEDRVYLLYLYRLEQQRHSSKQVGCWLGGLSEIMLQRTPQWKCHTGSLYPDIWYMEHPYIKQVVLYTGISYYKSSSVCLFVCLSVCSLSPPRSFDRSSPNLVGVCRWTSELPLRGSFSKRSTARRVNGSLSLSTILYMHQPHATRCNGSSCLQLQSLIWHLLLDGYRTASQQCI